MKNNKNDFSEREFLQSLEYRWGSSHNSDVDKGIGDDAAVLKRGKVFQTISTDMMVEGVHFNLKYFSPEDLAYKIIAVNVSDILAMGSVPKYVFLSAGITPGFKPELDGFIVELEKVIQKFDLNLLGGDTVKSDILTFNITIIGESEQKPVLRSGAEPGDIMMLTGFPGLAGLGFHILNEFPEYKEHYPESISQHLRPALRFEFVKFCIKHGLIKNIKAMIDVSDGVALDMSRLLFNSGLSGVIKHNSIPVHHELRTFLKTHDERVDKIFHSGEDFELLFCISPENDSLFLDAAAQTNTKLSRIGRVAPGDPCPEIIIEEGEQFHKLEIRGYDHFNE